MSRRRPINWEGESADRDDDNEQPPPAEPVTHKEYNRTRDAIQKAHEEKLLPADTYTKKFWKGVAWTTVHLQKGRQVVRNVAIGTALFTLFFVVPIAVAVKISDNALQEVYAARDDYDSQFFTDMP